MSTQKGAVLSPLHLQSFEEWVGVHSTYDIFKGAAASHGTALIAPQSGLPGAPRREFNYEQMRQAIAQAANAFRRLGVGRQDVVAYMLPSLPETQFVLWGAEAAGIAFPLNPLLQPGELAALCRAAKVSVLVAVGPAYSPEVWAKAKQVQALIASSLLLMSVGGLDAETEGSKSFESECAKSEMYLAFDDEPQLDDIAAYFHTGGTTGSPKLVKHTHRNQVAGAFGCAHHVGIRSDDVMMNGLPMFHVGGTIACSLSTFAARGTVLLLSPLGFRDPTVAPNIWKTVERYGVTLPGGVPTSLAVVARVPVGDANISSIRLTIAGAASTPKAVATEIERVTGKPFREIYGMTECGGIIAVDAVQGERTLGSAGLPIPFAHVHARPVRNGMVASEPCAPSDVGVLVVKGPNVSPGYQDSLQTRKLFTSDGWLISGDMGYVSEDGKVFITGREKDLIIRSGHNIDPMSIEEALLAHPGVMDAAAVGQPDAYAGEVPVAYVVRREGHDFSEENLLEFARSTITEPPAVPRRVFIVDSIPQTAVGKVFKPPLRVDCTARLVRELLAECQVESVEVEDDAARGQVVRLRLSPEVSDAELTKRSVAGRLSGFLFKVDFVELRTEGSAQGAAA